MPLSWNEIKTRASAFSKSWDVVARVEFLLKFYYKIISY